MDYSLENTQSVLPLLSLKASLKVHRDLTKLYNQALWTTQWSYNEFTSHLHLVRLVIMRWFTSRACKTPRFQLWVNSEKWQRFWLAIALKKSTDMSLIGYIAQRCKNTLDNFPDLLIVFAFVWGYLAPSSTPYNQAWADIRDSMTDDIRGGNCPPLPPPNVTHDSKCILIDWTVQWNLYTH